jgi:MoxR-like ATPase
MQHEVKTVMDMAEFIKLQAAARHVHTSDELLNYILHLVTFSQKATNSSTRYRRVRPKRY